MPSRLEAALLAHSGEQSEPKTKAPAGDEEEEEGEADRNTLIFSFLTILLSIPALVGA